jgi:hypothetical protein
MNFNKEIKNTHDEIIQLHQKFNILRDDVICRLDLINESLKEKEIIPFEASQNINEEEKKMNIISVNIEQPRLITNTLCTLIILNILITGTFLFNSSHHHGLFCSDTSGVR